MTPPNIVHDPHEVRLGKGRKKSDPRTLRMRAYTAPSLLPISPFKYDVTGYSSSGEQWGMLGNDRYGDCTVCAYAHSVQAWTDAVDQMAIVSEEDVVAAYLEISPDDEGAYCLDALNYFRKKGVAGHRLNAYAEVHPTELAYMKTALWMFGSLYLGLQLALVHQTQEVWDVDAGPRGKPGSWGGHAVNVVAYDEAGVTLVTWGQRKRATWAFIQYYCDEAYAILGPEWFGPDGRSAEGSAGFDLDRLKDDLRNIGGKGPIEPEDDPPGPPPFPSSSSWIRRLIERLLRWLRGRA